MSEVTYGVPLNQGHQTIDVLPFLVGLPWNNITEAWLYAVRPSKMRVTYGEVHTDSCLWRVTITLNRDDTIAMIQQEVQIGLANKAPHGMAMEQMLHNMRNPG